MVILQFNKLIRNKWVWGVFAVAISAFFAFDFLIDDIGRESTPEGRGSAGTLAGEDVKAGDFQALADDARGIGRNRDWRRNAGEVNRSAWESYAALKVAEKGGFVATDADVQNAIRNDPSFQRDGGFSFQQYQALLRENSVTPERFEEFLKRRLTIMRINQDILGAAAWASPMEIDQSVADMTDTFTVKVARFEQDAKEADAITIDDDGIRKWYDDNQKSLELPERVKIRFVKFDASKKEILDKMVVSDDELRDQYDATVDKYTSTDTNGVETVKKFEEVKDQVEKEVRLIAAVQYYETNLNARVYAIKAAEGASRLDEIAAEENLKVVTSDWFSIEGGYKEGFMKYASSICSGASGFNDAVAELDPSSEDLRYAVISSSRNVWIIEKAETSPKHTPTFEECKDIIKPRALRAAKADAFKAQVEAIAKQGAQVVLAGKDVSTNITFSVSELDGSSFQDAMTIARAAMSLKKGEVSEFTLTGTGRALLVVCEDRVAADAAKVMVTRSQAQMSTASIQRYQLPTAWLKWNLDRLGFESNEISSTEIVADEEE